MSELLILALIIFFVASLLITIAGYVVYSGLLCEINIKTGSPPIKNITFAYKFKQGPYKECGTLFTESCSIGPKLLTFGVYYDDPNQVPAEKCRYAVGSILSEDEERPDDEALQLYQKFGFRIFSFPTVTHSVNTTFPHRTPLSIYLGVQRVYPHLSSYIKERKLCAHPFLEIYRGDLIHFMAPLARQSDFYVPEAREAERKSQDGEEVEEDGRTDVTGADSNSETSSVSHTVLSDSRETSLTVSSVPSLSPGDHRDGDGCSDRSSGESVDSGSSFEELDLEQAEAQDDPADPRVKLITAPSQDREAVAEGEE